MKKTLISLFFLYINSIIYGQDGTLDPSFASSGILEMITHNPITAPTAISTQSTGKIIIAGTRYDSANYGMRLMRLNSDGTTDNSFGVNGIATTAFGTLRSSVSAIAIQSDNKILMAGTVFRSFGEGDFAVVRYTSAGVLDGTFNGNGKHIVNFNVGTSTLSKASAITLQPDGKILVSGQIGSSIALVRFNINGTLDSTFNQSGIVITNISSNRVDNGLRVTYKDDGKIILMSGVSMILPNSGSTALVQYNANGTLDTQFGTNGILLLKPKNLAYKVLKSGKIIVQIDSIRDNFTDSIFYILSRYQPDGALDTTFGKKGYVQHKLGFNGLHFTLLDIVEQKDDKIIVAGSVAVPRSSFFILSRHHPNGDIDTTLGTRGKSVTSGSLGGTEQYVAMSLQNDEKLLICSKYNLYSRYLRFNNSVVVGVDKPIEKEVPLSMFPNPMTNLLNIDFKEIINVIIKLTITDLSGRTVYQNKYAVEKTNTALQINVENLITGLYIVTITTEKETKSQLMYKN